MTAAEIVAGWREVAEEHGITAGHVTVRCSGGVTIVAPGELTVSKWYGYGAETVAREVAALLGVPFVVQ